MTVRDYDRGARRLTEQVTRLSAGVKVRAGISEEAGARQHPSGGTVADVAELVEFGTEATAPASFVRAVVDEQQAKLEHDLAAASERVARGASIEGSFARIGSELADKMRSRVPVDTGTTAGAVGFTVEEGS